MAAITTLAIAAVGVGITAYGAISAGNAAKEGAALETSVDRFNAKQSEIAATEEEAARRKDLNDTLSTISAIRANRGLSDSPGGAAVRAGLTDEAEKAIMINRLNRSGQAFSYYASGNMAQLRGRSDQNAGYFKAASSITSAAASYGSK